MRAPAIVIALSLLTPPATVEEQSLDCSLDGCESGGAPAPASEPELTTELEATTEPEAEPEPAPATEQAPEPAGPTGEELKAEARSLAAVGQHDEAIEVYQQAYQLAPGDHIIAYDIAELAQKLGRCGLMKRYLEHFVQYADPNIFPNKINKARRALNSASCVISVDSEVGDAIAAGASKVPVPVARDDGAGLVGGGVVMVAVGILAFGAGIALVALGISGTTEAANEFSVPDPKYRNFMISGGFVGPAGVAFIAGGGVMIARGKQPSYMTVTPTGLAIRF